MPDLTEIISDLNVTIADTETALMALSTSTRKVAYSNVLSTEAEYKRAIGQLKAARASLIRLNNNTDAVRVGAQLEVK